jgi:hypothetical protein
VNEDREKGLVQFQMQRPPRAPSIALSGSIESHRDELAALRDARRGAVRSVVARWECAKKKVEPNGGPRQSNPLGYSFLPATHTLAPHLQPSHRSRMLGTLDATSLQPQSSNDIERFGSRRFDLLSTVLHTSQCPPCKEYDELTPLYDLQVERYALLLEKMETP